MALVAIAMLAQVAFARAVGEPYPAIMMPGFGGTMTDDTGAIEFENAEVHADFADCGTRELTLGELLGQAPASMRLSIARTMFGTPRKLGRPKDAGWKAFVKTHVFPILGVRNRVWYENYIAPETARWAERRLRALYPSCRPRALRVEWIRHRIAIGPGEPKRAKQVTGSFAMELGR